MIVLGLLGFTYCVPILMLFICFLTFFSLIENQFGVKIKSVHTDNAFELSFSEFFRVKGSFPSILLLILHNRILLWNRNTKIFSMLLEPYIFSHTFLYLIKAVAF